MDERRRRVTGWLMVAGALVGVVGLVGAGVARSANELSYEVLVTSPSGNGKLPICKPTMIVINPSTGAELPCAGTPEEGFTAAERQEILGQAATMAADSGVDGVDAFKLSELATNIGHRHSEDAGSVLPTFFLGIAALGGVALITGITRKVLQLRASQAHWRDWQGRLGR